MSAPPAFLYAACGGVINVAGTGNVDCLSIVHDPYKSLCHALIFR